MTQTQMLAFARLKIPEVSSVDVLSDVNLLILLNQACTEFINKTDALPTSTTFNLVLDQAEYSLSTYVPTFGKIRDEGIWFYNVSSTRWWKLESTTLTDLINKFPSYLSVTSGIPLRITIEGDTLTLNPPASSTYAGSNYLRIFYYKRSVDMSAAAQYPFSGSTTVRYSHLADYEEVPLEYVKYLVKQMLGKMGDAEEAKSFFYTKCMAIKQALKYRPDLKAGTTAQGAGNMLQQRGAFNR